MDKLKKLEIKYMDISELKPYENNPRKNEEAVPYVINSIKKFGFRNPIIIDKDGVIVAGHTRYKAANELGLKEVPVILADDLTPEQVKAFRLVDNKVSEQASWNYDLLNLELEDIDLNMEDFGFLETNNDDIINNVIENTEIDLSKYDDDKFEHTCPKCGFKFED